MKPMTHKEGHSHIPNKGHGDNDVLPVRGEALLSTFEKTLLWAHQLWVHEVWCREGVVVVPAATGPFVAFW